MSNLNINWQSIRPIDGSQQKGFEELCCQLADIERPADTAFNRKGTPDAGVECYAAFKDGSEWGWQAKYFDALGDTQYAQLDHSVQTALTKHPHLVRYYICIPFDLPDPRIEGKLGAQDKWNKHLNKWKSWAQDRGMDVEFILWNSYELIKRLVNSANRGRTRYWFDIELFDTAWFKTKLKEAIDSAGPRYSPKLNIELPIATLFEAFGRTEWFFDSVKAHARPLRDKLGWIRQKDIEDDSAVSKENASADHISESEKLSKQTAAIIDFVRQIISRLGEITPQAIESLPFQQIEKEVNATLSEIDSLKKALRKSEREFQEQKAQTEPIETNYSYYHNPFTESLNRIYNLERELIKLKNVLADAICFAEASLLLLTGRAGTGKTHLLCDITQKRINEGLPTVLLMGQRFLTSDDPWTQALRHLDLAHISAEEFVDALETAAQAAGCRALVIIDALNEGNGRQIWPDHLVPFLLSLSRSKWIVTVLSVRSPYERKIIPESIQQDFINLEHQGFAEHEYDAVKTFFNHYQIELPSTPLLVPEFQNPLFLKLLCHGLKESGKSRLPRGFHGITAIFDLFLSAVNNRLSEQNQLNFNPKHFLVRKAVELLASRFVKSGEQFIPQPEAENCVNSVLPGREFSRSLYHGLVNEGIIVEQLIWDPNGATREVVQISYERLFDYLVAKQLLDISLNKKDLNAPFKKDGALAFIMKEDAYVSTGLLEALCVQVAERTKKEIIELAPGVEKQWNFNEAFRQSIIWRSPDSFSDTTTKILNSTIRNQHDYDAVLDTFLTTATIPEHPFNAYFLHDHLNKLTMPDRDAQWSIYLHHTFESHSVVDRIIAWAWSLTSEHQIDEEAVELSAIALAWMFTSSNRFLRDRATKALVNLLTGRIPSVLELIELFINVDDLHVSERIYAVAYGCAMRSHDAQEIGQMAQLIYDRIFKDGPPPAHILLRDYARGVIERALFLGSSLDVVIEKIRPPYKSKWPHIPTDEEIEPLKPNWDRGSHDSGDLEWSKNRIGSSIFNDDFAWYVIGTNSHKTNLLSLRLDEPVWQSYEERFTAFIDSLSEDEKKAWESYSSTHQKYEESKQRFFAQWIRERTGEELVNSEINFDSDPKLLALGIEDDKRYTILQSKLQAENAKHLKDLLMEENDWKRRNPPGFDLSIMQRYILWRVFDLGWTTERFGYFDRHSIGYHGRDAHKAERIGKKYQWIAYHEIMALAMDHFQYRDEFNESDQAYEGPWQDYLRNIDPSCTLRNIPGGTSWGGHLPAWWDSIGFNNWSNPSDHQEWVQQKDDLSAFEQLLSVNNPQDGSIWLNLNGYFNWRQPIAPDRDPYDHERRELWYIFHGYIIKNEHVESFMAWAGSVNFWGRWMPEPPNNSSRLFLGENVWSPAAQYFQRPYYGNHGWVRPDHDCPNDVYITSTEYLNESSGFDCSTDDNFTLHLPTEYLVTGMGLRWTGRGANYCDTNGRCVIYDPTVYSTGPSALLIHKDAIKNFLEQEKLSLCWTVLGEKRVIGAGITPKFINSLQLSGAYILKEDGPVGNLKYKLG